MAVQARQWLAVDLGGTKIAAALVDDAGAVGPVVQEPTCQQGPELGIAQVIRLLDAVQAQSGDAAGAPAAIGVGIPAVLATGTDEVIWAPNLAGWRHVDLAGALRQRFGLPVAVEYDGHTATLAEWWLGGGRGSDSFVTLIIGTGVGGGMVLDGRLVRGVNRLAGAAGWFALEEDRTRAGACARALGSWEAAVAGPGIALRAQERAAQTPASRLAQVAPPLTAAHVFEAAAAGDAAAQALLDETADRLGLGIANIVSLVNPERVVLGGGVGSRCGALLERIGAQVTRWAQPISAASCRIVVSPLGSAAGLAGAARAAMLRFDSS